MTDFNALFLKAKQNQSEAGRRYGRGKKPDPTLPKIEKVNAMEQFFKVCGISKYHYYQARRIKRLGDKFCPELRLHQRVETEELKLRKAQEILDSVLAVLVVKETERQEKEQPFPKSEKAIQAREGQAMTDRTETLRARKALDAYADNLLSRDREKVALERELAAVRKSQGAETQEKEGDHENGNGI